MCLMCMNDCNSHLTTAAALPHRLAASCSSPGSAPVQSGPGFAAAQHCLGAQPVCAKLNFIMHRANIAKRRLLSSGQVSASVFLPAMVSPLAA